MWAVNVDFKYVVWLCISLLLQNTESCPTNAKYDPQNRMCYWIGTSGTVQECHDSCVSNKGTIAAVPNTEAQQFLIEKFLGQFTSSSDSIWIGINDMSNENVFTDWLGKTQNFSYWRNGQPNDNTEVTDQDCIAMFGGSENFRWQDKECSNTYACLCSYKIERSRFFYKILEDGSKTGCGQSVITARSRLECVTICASTVYCSSVNHNNDASLCELNLCRTNGSIVNRPGYSYYKEIFR